MTIDIARMRELSKGDDQEAVPVTRRMLRAIVEQLDAFDRLKSHIDWRERVNAALRDLADERAA
ncbi:MAG: hypothetical protein P4L68_08150 [Methylovirgula sp.]|nr:hypothetical protein [Methylovirgula sp.]